MSFFDFSSGKSPLVPKLVSVLRQGYPLSALPRDILAGVTVGVVALPLSMALAIASGVPPERGLYTAIVGALIIALLGGSRFQVSGPTGAFVAIIYSIVYRYGYEGLVVATLMAGIILVIFGLCRLGTLIKYVPYPVTTGFTTGIAVLIFSTQVKDLFGLPMKEVPPEFFPKWLAYLESMPDLSGTTTFITLATLAILLAVRRFIPKVPAPVVGVLFGGLCTGIFNLPIDTIGSRFGEIPQTFPALAIPHITMDLVRQLLPEAFTIALLAGIESLLTCVVADGMTGDKHNSNAELFAQGMGNIGSSLFGGIPVTGAIARTATNIRCGGVSPLSAIVHSLVVLAFLLWLSPLALYIPLASLAAVLALVAWDMSEPRRFRRMFHGTKSDLGVMLLTFGLTVVIDLTVAVNVGVILASLLFMRRMSLMTRFVTYDSEKDADERDDHDDKLLPPHTSLPAGVEIFAINGPLFFGVTDRFQDTIEAIEQSPKVFIIDLARVPSIDATAMNTLELFLARRTEKNYDVILAEVPLRAHHLLDKMGILNSVGTDNIFPDLESALARARVLVKRHDEQCR